MSRELELLQAIIPGQVAAITGTSSTGKTLLAQAADAAWPRRIVFDPYCARDRQLSARGKAITPWSGRIVNREELRRKAHLLDKNRVKLIFNPESVDEDICARKFEWLAEVLWETGDFVMVCEEAALYSRQVAKIMNRLANGSRHASLSIVLLSQRYTRLHADARGGVTLLVAYQQASAQDIRELSLVHGADFAHAVAGLAEGDAPLTWQRGEVVHQALQAS